jgi:hypothetical protein
MQFVIGRQAPVKALPGAMPFCFSAERRGLAPDFLLLLHQLRWIEAESLWL